MSTTEERVSAALAARAGGITMDSSTIEKRFAEVQERGKQDRKRRRGLVIGAAVLAAAAVAVGAFTVGDSLLGDETAAPRIADSVDTVPAPAAPRPMPNGAGDPAPGRYVADAAFVPFAVTIPDKVIVAGSWHYELGDSFWISLDNSVETGFANVGLNVVEQVYRPGGPLPFAKDAPTQPAPADADGWVAWLEATGAVEVRERTTVRIDGAAATRLTLVVSTQIAPSGFPCAPGESCLALAPEGPALVGGTQEGVFTSELTLVPAGDQLLVSVANGRTNTEDRWLPLLRSVLESFDFA